MTQMGLHFLCVRIWVDMSYVGGNTRVCIFSPLYLLICMLLEDFAHSGISKKLAFMTTLCKASYC